jgi:quinol monooxygenase YgiN
MSMFFRVVRGSMDSAKIDDVLALREEIINAFRRQPGFVGVQVAANRSTGELVTITIWDAKDAVELSPREILGDILMDRFAALVQVESVDSYEFLWSA